MAIPACGEERCVAQKIDEPRPPLRAELPVWAILPNGGTTPRGREPNGSKPQARRAPGATWGALYAIGGKNSSGLAEDRRPAQVFRCTNLGAERHRGLKIPGFHGKTAAPATVHKLVLSRNT